MLSAAGWLTPEHAATMRRMIGLRNIVVNGYTAVDPAILRDVVEHHLGDFGEFVASIRHQLATR